MQKVTEFFRQLPGELWLALFSLEMLAMIPFCLVSGLPFPDSVVNVYLGVIGSFAVTRSVKHFVARKGPVEPNLKAFEGIK